MNELPDHVVRKVGRDCTPNELALEIASLLDAEREREELSVRASEYAALHTFEEAARALLAELGLIAASRNTSDQL